MLAAFLRNDDNPGLSTIAVLLGGIFYIFGDYFFVFTCNMGIYGTGLATAIGSVILFLIMLTHFIARKNTLCLVKIYLVNFVKFQLQAFLRFLLMLQWEFLLFYLIDK